MPITNRFELWCDGGCTRPLPTDNPYTLDRLGWLIIGPVMSEWHQPHSPRQPQLVSGYTQWHWPTPTKAYCSFCAPTYARPTAPVLPSESPVGTTRGLHRSAQYSITYTDHLPIPEDGNE